MSNKQTEDFNLHQHENRHLADALENILRGSNSIAGTNLNIINHSLARLAEEESLEEDKTDAYRDTVERHIEDRESAYEETTLNSMEEPSGIYAY